MSAQAPSRRLLGRLLMSWEAGSGPGDVHIGSRPGDVQTAAIIGVEAKPVHVEVTFTNGLPGISIVGMPDTAVSEARMRVSAALRSSGFDVPCVHILVNLAPSDIPKSGSGFDFPIAIGILLATGQISSEVIYKRLCVGELSLDGSVRPVRGMLAYEQLAREMGLDMLSALIKRGAVQDSQSRYYCVESLMDLQTRSYVDPLAPDTRASNDSKDYRDIAGNDFAKRALTIAATGEHALMMIGPPGSGKSMMASRLPTIMAPLNENERFSSAMIHSVAGLPYDTILEGQKPFRAPHHSATRAGLLGGGSPVVPGEVSLAHNGILFLDEIAEFGTSVLQLLRQPIESGMVSLARARGTTVLPAHFMLVAASNPCPCGYYGDPERACSCSDAEIRRYQASIGGPLLDRIDMVLDVWRSKPGEVLATGSGKSSASIRSQVLEAQEFALWRAEKQQERFVYSALTAFDAGGEALVSEEAFAGESSRLLDAGEQATAGEDAHLLDAGEKALDGEGARLLEGIAARKGARLLDAGERIIVGEGARLLDSCELGRRERRHFEEAAERLNLSGRGIMRALAVARTIADLEQSVRVSSEHLLEALTFRADGRCGNGSN